MGITCQYLINYIEEKGLPSDHNDYDLYYPLEEPYSLFYNVEQHELAFYKNGIQVKTVDIKFVLDRKTLNNNLTKFNTIYELIDYYDDLYQKEQEEKNKKQEAVKDFLSK